jgi:ADP-heptose:LPS heptosyltransferase
VSCLGARVILEVPQSLIALFGTLDGVTQLVVRGEQLPEFDYHCSLMSLPMLFQSNLHSIPTPISYLQHHPAKAFFWKKRLGKKTKPRIGLVWSGNPDHTNDQNRSISLSELISCLPERYEYISLQKKLRPNDRETLDKNRNIHNFIDDLKDFSDTAGLIECLDLVISVDTSVAHLAGSLGKETWVLLPFRPDWRWMLDRNDSPWYKSLKLYRQQAVNAWDGVYKEIKRDLLGRGLTNLKC